MASIGHLIHGERQASNRSRVGNRGLGLAALALAALLLNSCRISVGRPIGRPYLPIVPSEPPVRYATSLPTCTPTPTPSITPMLRFVQVTSTPLSTPTPTEPLPTATLVPESTPTVGTYTVLPGDTLYSIARRFGTSVEALARANNIADPSLIRVGQVLVIPTALGSNQVEGTTTPAGAAGASAAPPSAPTPTSTPAIVSAVSVRKSAITLQLSEITPALYPLPPDHPGYPYQGLDPARVGPVRPQEFQPYVLENIYTQVVILPELGGRIYQITDLVSRTALLYNNPAIVPTNWGIRGWWLAAGGIEWGFPTEEHGLVDYVSWQVQTEQRENEAAVILTLKEELTGIDLQIRIGLTQDDASVHVRTELYNNTPIARNIQYWQNAMYAPGGLSAPQPCWLTLPAEQAIVHSTSDPALQAGQVIPWPVYGSRNLMDTSNWRGHLGLFAYPRAQHGYAAIQCKGMPGLLQLFEPTAMQGVKFFGLGDIPYSRYSGIPSSYIEMWVGLTPTFSEYAALAAGERRVCESTYLPLPAMPPLSAANRTAALAVSSDKVAIAVARSLKAHIRALDQAGQEIATWTANLSPGKTWEAPERPPSIAEIQIVDADTGQLVLSWKKE